MAMRENVGGALALGSPVTRTAFRLFPALLLGCLVAGACGGGGSLEEVREVAAPCILEPVWADASTRVLASGEASDGVGAPEFLRIYLDVSQPMSGFMPVKQSPDDPASFRTIVNMIPDHMSREYGRTGATVQWWGVGKELEKFEGIPVIKRSTFQDGSTQLDLAVTQILEDLKSGKTEAAVLVTDLLATTDVVGAMGVANALESFVRSEAVRSGEVGVGLLGVKTDYWGHTSRGKCSPKGGVGCRYSERGRGYVRLPGKVNLPVYALVFGVDKDRVQVVGQGLEVGVRELGLSDVQWELFNADVDAIEAKLACQVHKPGKPPGSPTGRHMALFEDDEGPRCTRSDPVAFTCLWGSTAGFEVTSLDASWEEVTAKHTGTSVGLFLDCGPLVGSRPTGGLVVSGETSRAASGATARPDWSSWSTETDEQDSDLGRTLQLKYFVEKVRQEPAGYSLRCEPLL